MAIRESLLQEEDNEQIGVMTARLVVGCNIVLQDLSGTLGSSDVDLTSLILL